jgi:hypothetical protein
MWRVPTAAVPKGQQVLGGCDAGEIGRTDGECILYR